MADDTPLTAREARMIAFAEELAAELGKERTRHAATERRLRTSMEKQSSLMAKLKATEADWKARKKSWKEVHNRHLICKAKYSKLLKTVQAAAAQRNKKKGVQPMARAAAPPPPTAAVPSSAVPPPALEGHIETMQPCDVETPIEASAPVPQKQASSHVAFVPRRKRAELPAQTCTDCQRFFDATGFAAAFCKHGLQTSGRHRSVSALPSTPESFWQMSFSDDDTDSKVRVLEEPPPVEVNDRKSTLRTGPRTSESSLHRHGAQQSDGPLFRRKASGTGKG